MKLLAMANEVLRRMYLERAKRQNWTGWEDATPDRVAHIQIEQFIALEQHR